MKTIKLLKRLIDIYYYLLIIVMIAGLVTVPLFLSGEKYNVRFLDENIDLNALTMVKSILIIMLIVVLWLFYFKAIRALRFTVLELSKGRYFSRLVVYNFKRVGRLFLICGIGEIIAKAVLFFILSTGTYRIGIDTSVLVFIIMGLFFLFLSEIFAKGKQLQDENNLTI